MLKEKIISRLFKKDFWLVLKIVEREIIIKVLDFLDDNQILIKAVSLKQIITDEKLIVKFQNSLLAYKTEAKLKSTDKPKEFILKIIKEGTLLWERNFIRINIYQDTIFEVLNRAVFKDKKFPVVIEDISASGAKLIVEMPLNPGYLIDLNMEFFDFSFSKLRAEVVRKKKICRLQTRIYEVGIKFINLFDKRQELVKYINQKQIDYTKF